MRLGDKIHKDRLLKAAIAVVMTTQATGCWVLGKRDDAQNALDSLSAKKLSSAMEPQSTLARASGSGTQLRLLAIFPGAATVLPDQDFAFEGASGLNRVFGQQSRPAEALSQMALRTKVASLCKTNVGAASTTLFNLEAGKQLLSGETAPADPKIALALAAARNAWLHPYLPDDAEVQELAALYDRVKAMTSADGGEEGAKRAVCMAALLAPQFWMGNSEIDDAAKRVSVELFRRVPPMQELADFKAGKFTIDAYFDKLFAESSGREGFRKTTRGWHEEWLGLREFMDPGFLDSDRRSTLIDSVTPGASNMTSATFSASAVLSAAAPQTIAPARQAGLTASSCVSTQAQQFDPDTKMIAWEHYNFDSSTYNFVGGFIRSGDTLVDSGAQAGLMSLDDGGAALAAIGLMPVADAAGRRAMLRDLCTGTPFADQAGVKWIMCDGALSLTAAGAANLRDTIFADLKAAYDWQGYSLQADVSTYPMSVWCGTNPDRAGCITSYRAYAGYIREALVGEARTGANRTRRYGSGTPGINSLADKFTQMAATTTTLGTLVVSRMGEFTAMAGGVPSGPGDALNAFYNEVAAGGWSYRTSLPDMKIPTLAGNADLGGGIVEARYNYAGGLMERFATTIGKGENNRYLPLMDTTKTPIGFGAKHRRVRRLGGQTNTWQDGYSPVKLWTTGGTVATCNNVDRLWASCFFRPRAVPIPDGQISSFRPDLGQNWKSSYVWFADSAMHPALSSAFYCGLPSTTALAAAVPGSDPNAAYTPLKTSISQLNDVASNIDLQFSAAPGVAVPVAAGTALGIERDAFKEIYAQLRNEPYKLIDELVLDGKDYRQLLTSETTRGNSCLKFFYDTQGFYLARHDEAAGAVCRGPGSADAVISSGPPISTGLFMNAAGSIGNEDSTIIRTRAWDKAYGRRLTEIPPRVISGIVTMPAFLGPLGTGGALKARSVSSRFFSRLLCDQPNFYDPLQDKVDGAGKNSFHRSFISERKHLQTDCFQCHRNLDPLASAMSWTFRGMLTTDAKTGEVTNALGGEGGPQDFEGELDVSSMKGYYMPGLRHGGLPMGEGAFMGEPVKGIRDLSAKVADSDKFAACVTQTAFTYLFGRSVQFADVDFFNQMSAEFKDPAKANYRFVDLVKRMIKSDFYQRKN
jgi:hypothetical protein